jgi:hypothetical protein
VALVEFQSGVVTRTSWRASAGSTLALVLIAEVKKRPSVGALFDKLSDSTVENDVAAVAISRAQPGHALRPTTRLRKTGPIIAFGSFWLHQGLSMFWMRS